jgi:hypothetical protein
MAMPQLTRRFLEFDKIADIYPTVPPFLCQYLTNADYQNISSSTMSKSTLMIPNNFMDI